MKDNAQRNPDTSAGTPAMGRYTGYTWDVRNLVATVKAGASPAGPLDTWSYTYDGRGPGPVTDGNCNKLQEGCPRRV
ncbi:hypothetical protein ACWEOO_02630 [Kribbella sp. NPDC004138]